MSKITNLSRLASTISETAGGDLVVGTNPGGYDVVLIVGQSNTQTGVGKDATLDAPSDLIKQLGHASPYKDVIIEAEDPLSGPNPPGSTYIGFAMTFAKEYIQGGNLRADRKVCIVHAGWGGTGFGNSNRWNPGQDLYRWAVRRANVVLNDYPGSRLVGILWHQGESDRGQTKEWYSTRLDWMIDRMRNDIVGDQSKTPFITGGMVPDWVASNTGADLIEEALKETKDRVPYTEFADPTAADASGIYLGSASTSTDGVNYMGDSIHYNAAGQRAMGKRYYSAWTRAFDNTLQTTVPDPVTNVYATSGDGYAAVSWSDPSQTVTGYDLYYKLSSDAEWIHQSTINQANTPGYTLGGLTNGLEYDFKIVCFNDLGRSEDSVVVTATPSEYELLSSDDDCVMFLDAEGGAIQDQTVAKLGKASGPTITNSSTSPVVAGNDAARGPVFLLSSEDDLLTTNLTLNTSEYTKSAWVRWYDYSGSNYGNVISAYGTSNHAFGVESSSGVVNAGHNGSWSSIQASNNAIPEHEWAHVALTYNINDGPYDGTTTNARAFINGEQVDTATFSALSGNPDVVVFDFGGGSGNGWRGAADNVRLHNKALGLCEIKELAGLGKLPAIQTGANLLYRYDSTLGDNFNRLDRSYGCYNPFSETPHTERKYSILDRVERYRRSDGTFRFRIVFPNWKWQSTNSEELPYVLEFSQDDNPYDTTAGGSASNVVIHEALQGLSMSGFGGLRISALETDGSPHENTVFDANTTTSPSNWYIPIGFLGGWDEAAMPVYADGTGTNATSTTVIELYAIMD